jgi:predicted DNA-binding transcriptional regulator YafY
VTEQVRRASRLVEIERRLRASPQGLTVRELSEALGYSVRTIQRDLNVLESELGVPLMEGNGRRWRLMPGSSPIGAVRFTLHEARSVYLATRLLLRQIDEHDPDAVAALDKLADALPPSIGALVHSTADQLRRRPETPGYTAHMRTLTQAWAEQRQVRIRYRSQHAREVRETIVDPYLLEASATGSATYLYAHSSAHRALRTFKLDRIVEAMLLDDHFALPDLGDLTSRLSLSWGGAVLGEDEFDVVLHFDASVADRVRETNWHSSQRLSDLPGGGLCFEARLPSLLEFVPWVRSWGEAVEAVAPPELRDAIAASMRRAAALYG